MLVVTDVETGGLSPAKHALLEIACQVIDPDATPLAQYQAVIKPSGNLELDPEAMRVNKLTKAELDKGYPEGPLLQRLTQRLQGHAQGEPIHLCGWNVAFDERFLYAAYQRNELQWPFHHRTLDVQGLWFFVYGQSTSLERAAKSLWPDVTVPHRAMGDVEITTRILRYLIGNVRRPESRHGQAN